MAVTTDGRRVGIDCELEKENERRVFELAKGILEKARLERIERELMKRRTWKETVRQILVFVRELREGVRLGFRQAVSEF